MKLRLHESLAKISLVECFMSLLMCLLDIGHENGSPGNKAITLIRLKRKSTVWLRMLADYFTTL